MLVAPIQSTYLVSLDNGGDRLSDFKLDFTRNLANFLQIRDMLCGEQRVHWGEADGYGFETFCGCKGEY